MQRRSLISASTLVTLVLALDGCAMPASLDPEKQESARKAKEDALTEALRILVPTISDGRVYLGAASMAKTVGGEFTSTSPTTSALTDELIRISAFLLESAPQDYDVFRLEIKNANEAIDLTSLGFSTLWVNASDLRSRVLR